MLTLKRNPEACKNCTHEAVAQTFRLKSLMIFSRRSGEPRLVLCIVPSFLSFSASSFPRLLYHLAHVEAVLGKL